MRMLRRSLRTISITAVVWAGLVTASGGFRVRIGPLGLSSRRPENALIIALVAAVMLIATMWHEGPDAVAEEWAWWRQAAARVTDWTRCHAHHVPALFAVVVIALRVYRWTTAPSLWLDEEATALIAREHSFARLGSVWLGTSAPFGWLATQRAAILVGGTGELVLRFLSTLFGTATLAAAVWIGRRWMSAVGATALVLLCAFNYYLALYWFEAKQYSADACWALVLPALAAWAIEADTDARRIRRAAVWWGAATIGQWMANGAAIVTPGCALVLLGSSWLRHRRRVTGAVAALGMMWITGVLLHYQLSVRYTLHSTYFYDYWALHFPPPSIGVTGTARWLFDQLEVLGVRPAGTELWVSLWILALCGFLFARRRPLGLVFATVPLAAFLLAALRIVPLYERFVLWIVPALAVGVALAVDRAVRVGYEAARRHNLMRLAIAVAVVASVARLCADVVFHGQETFRLARASSGNRGLDDRAAVRWLMAQRQRGDPIVTTPLGWPAVWWYGDIPIGDDDLTHGTLRDGGSMLQVTQEEPGCDDSQLRSALKGQRRVLAFISFRDFPYGFEDLLLERLEELGTRVESRQFAGSRGVVIELDPAGEGERAPGPSRGDLARGRERPGGCVRVQPAIPQ